MLRAQYTRLVRASFPVHGVREISTSKVLRARVLKSGDKIGLITFNFKGVSKVSAPEEETSLTSRELFDGRRSLVFLHSTSALHRIPFLAQYQRHYHSIRAEGIDDVYCGSVESGRAMRKWLLSQGCVDDDAAGVFGFQGVKPLPGGHRLFRASGSLSMMNVHSVGSHEGSALIITKDMKVEKLFKPPSMESEESAETCASNVLEYLRENVSCKKDFTEHYSPHTTMITSISSTSSLSDPMH